MVGTAGARQLLNDACERGGSGHPTANVKDARLVASEGLEEQSIPADSTEQ
jgi:hypothetical protein